MILFVIAATNGRKLQVSPLRSPPIVIHPNAKWSQNGVTVAGGNGPGNEINQLEYPYGLYVDDDQTIYIADCWNHRIVEWKQGATSGQVLAGGNGQGNRTDQLNHPNDVIVDKGKDSLIINDQGNRRVVLWSRRHGTRGETIISNVDCVGLAMDENESLYVVDREKHTVRRYSIGDTEGTVVAGGNGPGNGLHQLFRPEYVFVDQDNAVYVSDRENHRVMKWEQGAKQGIVVAGGQGEGNIRQQLWRLEGIVVDQLGTVYVADGGSHRIMRWSNGATDGSIIVGENSYEERWHQLNYPIGLSFDRYGNLYVADTNNHRVQKFNIQETTN